MPRPDLALRTALAAALLGLAGCGPAEDRSAEKPGVPADASEGERAPPGTGVVAGKLSYPSDYLPADLKVCAEPVPSGASTCDSERRGSTYSLALAPGRYTVWAETGDWPGVRAYYSRAVPCGLAAECEDHSPIVVTVAAGQTVSGIDPGDWYDLGRQRAE